MKKTLFSFLIAIFAMAGVATGQNPQPFSIPGNQVSNTDTSFRQSASISCLLNAQQQTNGLVGRFHVVSVRNENPMDTLRSDTIYYIGGLINVTFVTTNLNEGDTVTSYVVSAVADTSLPYTVGLEQYTQFGPQPMAGWTAFASQVPVVGPGMQTDTTYTTGVFNISSVDCGFGGTVFLEAQGTIPGFATTSAQITNIQTNVQLTATAASGTSGMVRARAIAGNTIGVGPWMPFNTESPTAPLGIITIGETNMDSIEVCISATSNDQTATVLITYGNGSVLLNQPFTSPTLDTCVWLYVGQPDSMVVAMLTVSNTLTSVQDVATGSTDGYPAPTASIISSLPTGWYTAEVKVRTNMHGSNGGSVSVIIPELNNQSFGPVLVGTGIDTAVVVISGLMVNQLYSPKATCIQLVDGQTVTTPQSQLVMPTATAGTVSYTHTVSQTSYNVCVQATTMDTSGINVHVLFYQGQNTGSPLIDTMFVYAGPVCFSATTTASTSYTLVVTGIDTVGSDIETITFSTPGVGQSPQNNLSNANVDQVSGWVQIPFFCNPMSDTATAVCLIGLSPNTMVTPVDTVLVLSPQYNNAFIFDASGYQQIGQNVTVYYTMTSTNNQGGTAGAIENFFTLEALPDTTTDPEPEPEGPVEFIGVNLLAVDSLAAIVQADFYLNGLDSVDADLFWYTLAGDYSGLVGPVILNGQTSNFHVTGLPPGRQIFYGFDVYVAGLYHNTFELWSFATMESPDPPVDPTGIEELLSQDPSVEGDVYDISGRVIATGVSLLEMERGQTSFTGVVIWTDRAGHSKQYLR